MSSVTDLRFELFDPIWLWGLAALPLLAVWASSGLVNLSPRQRVASSICRALLVTTLVLALAGLTLRRPSQIPYVVFAVDRSLSVGDEGRASAEEFLDRALEGRKSNQAAFLGFASTPGRVDSDRKLALSSIESEEARSRTDLAAAITAAAGSIPPGYSPRVVLLSDGNATSGNALVAASRAGVPIWSVPLPTPTADEVQVSEVVVPAQVREGEPFEIKVVVNSNHDDEGFLEILDSHGMIRPPEESRVKVRKGENTFRITHRLADQTFARIVARTRGFRDTRRDDNSGKGLVWCAGRPRVLLVDGDVASTEHLVEALNHQQIQVDPPRPPEGLPDKLAELQNYDLIILSNVPATHPKLTQNHFQQLRRYVQELGGGLLLIGGDHSFGPGGYARSPLEELLPVYCDFRREQDKPSLAMVLVLDRSNSMAGSKLETVKEAAKGAVEMLGPKDQVGVVVFDFQPHWASELRPCADKGRVLDDISRIEPRGGTRMLAAMKQAGQALHGLGNSAKFKHMVILSDGSDNEKGLEDFLPVVEQLAANRITISCVGVGGDVERGVLEQIARRGGGRSYFPEDVSSVPQIFAQETIQASKDSLIEEPFPPIPSRRTAALTGIDWAEAPDLNGYVLTRIKPTSEQILVTHRHDPLLAWWRTGLGMCGAFASDAQPRWAEPWISNWPEGYGRFWAQVVRHLMRKQEGGSSETTIDRKGSRVTVRLDAVDSDGAFLNGATTDLKVANSFNGSSSPSILQTAPGRYESRFDAPLAGDYWMVISQQSGDLPTTRQTRGLAVGYPDELRLKPCDETTLRGLAESTGGRYRPDPADVFRADGPAVPRDFPLWPLLIAVSALLLVLDVALRRVELGLFWRWKSRPA